MGKNETSKTLDRRKHIRHFTEHDGSYILCRHLLGQILNISEGGMAVRLVGDLTSFDSKLRSTPSCRSVIDEINRVPIKFVHSTDISRAIHVGYSTQTIGYEFDKINATRKEQIRKHITEIS